MSKYQKLFLLVIVLTLGAAIAVYLKPVNRGLDIAGGLRVVLEVDPTKPGDWPKASSERESKMSTIKETMVKRVGGVSGVTEPIVRVENPTAERPRLVVELPGAKDTDQALVDLMNTASLDFYYMKDVQSTVNPLASWRMQVVGDDERSYSFIGPKGQVLSTEEVPEKTEADREKNKQTRLKILEEVVGVPQVKPELTGAMLLGTAKSALQPATGQPIIEIEFNKQGTEKFAEFTRGHVHEHLGVFYNDALLTAPEIREPITDGKAIIEGFPSLKEATRIAEFLNAGALPVPLKVIAKDTVEPSLGKQAISQVLVAGIFGLLLVLAFMIIYYRLPGVLASIALCLYALFTIAAFALLNVTVSLAGMAALIISIGMAVDANILIFERLKEELKGGKTLRAAIDAGFNRAFNAIFDSNMCTAITCALLIWMGTPTVQSFAFTLLIGVAVSMFTAITVTRTFLHLLVNWEWAQKPSLYGLTTGWLEKSGLSWNIVGRWKLYFAISAVLIIPGLVVLGMYGLKPGIEFTSGTNMQASFKQKVTVPALLEVVNSVADGSQVQLTRGGKSAFITTKLLSENKDYNAKMSELQTAIDEKFGLDADGKPVFDSVSSVGPTISRELTTRAFWAIVIASVGIVLYLAVRFAIGGLMTGFKYGTCAIIAVAHDSAFIIGFYAIASRLWGWETNSLLVTAVLTVIGYSVHDTIVIFDRVRENLRHRQRGESFSQLANRSVLETLTRSINTSLTVMLTLGALIAFGGPLLREFYLTLMAGMAIGVYSTIFNATPMVILWDTIAERRRSGGGRRAAIEEKPMVGVSSNNGGGTDVDAAAQSAPEVEKTARPKRKKKRF